MKLLTVIIFKDSDAFDALNGKVCDKLSSEKERKFCGCWDIKFNREECITMIDATVNQFLESTDNGDVVFGCCMKDYDDIMKHITTDNCEINCTYAEVFLI